MKRSILLSLAVLLCLRAAAIPAKRGDIPYTLPDGSTILVQVHGDEFYHFMTDTQGRVIALGSDGYFHSAAKPSAPEVSRAVHRRRTAEAQRERILTRAAADDYPMTYGTRHIPVLLVSFSDRAFRIPSPQETFSRQLNEIGYSGYSATGSVRDFYHDNSHDLFDPVFDVYGPVQVSGTVASYGRSDDAPLAIYQAATMLDDEIDFSQYDTDGDGNVDMLLLYYAGYNEAEGASNTIWPHSWAMDYSDNASVRNNRFDNVHISNYFCTSELTGTSGVNIDGIGTTCHEFAHSLGLPDFYDTDYDEYFGEATSLYGFSTMDYGSYNNNGRTPPYFNAEERRMLGWPVEFEQLPADGPVSLKSIQTTGHVYYGNTTAEGEYFLYECRDGKGWDAYIQPGLLVYHVDKSSVRTVPVHDYESRRTVYVTPHDLWYDWETYNCINANASHPCFYLIPATQQGQLSYSSTLQNNQGRIPFPGTGNVTTYSPVDWNKSESRYTLRDIAYGGGTVTMTVMRNVRSLSGYVRDSGRAPIVGATVAIYPPDGAYAGAPDGRQRVSATPLASATSNASGYYFIDLTELDGDNFVAEASADGFIRSSRSISVPVLLNTADFALRAVNEPERFDLGKFDLEAPVTSIGYGYSRESIMGGVCFTASELALYAGRRVDAISFCYTSPSVKNVYGIVDFGSSRVATVPVEDPVSDDWNTVDLSGEGIVIPSGQDVWFGYALEEPDKGYPICIENSTSESGGLFYSSFSLTSSSWKSSSGNILVTVTLAPSEADMAYLGFNCIANPGEGRYRAGDYFTLTLKESYKKRVQSVEWYFDDEPVSGEAVRLTAGAHTVEARLTLASGAISVVELPIEAE